MIVIKIELWSSRTSKITELGRMVICNDGKSKDPAHGDYQAWLGKKGTFDKIKGKFNDTPFAEGLIDLEVAKEVIANPLRTASVMNYPRQAYSVWVLIVRALKKLGIQ